MNSLGFVPTNNPGKPSSPYRPGYAPLRDVLLGPIDSPESKKEYTRVINEWLAAGQLVPIRVVNGVCRNLSVAELLLRLWKHAEQHYRLVYGSPSRELEHFKYALDPAVDFYGPSPACGFGPFKVKASRRKMIDPRWFFVRFPATAKAGSRRVPQGGSSWTRLSRQE